MRIPIHKSVRLRLVLWFILITGIVTLISDYFLYQNHKNSLQNSIDDTLYLVAEEIEHTMLKSSPETWRSEITSVKDEFINSRFFIQVLELGGNPNESPRKITKSGVISGCLSNLNIEALSRDIIAPHYLTGTDKSLSPYPIRIIIFPFSKEQVHSKQYIVQVGTSLSRMYQSLDNLFVILLLVAPVILFLSAYGGFIIISKAINPIRSIVETAQKITTDDLSLRIESSRKDDEIGDLVHTFNQMIERLERSVIQIKQFSNDVSHELRTPLAVILGEIELVSKKHRSIDEYREALRSMYEETKKLESIINNLLLLSQMDFQKNLFTFTRMPLYEILMDCIKRIEAMAKQKKISLQIDKIEPVFIKGEQSLLQSLIINLAENAIKYSHKGKTVAISLEKRHDKAILTFKDEGIGIPRESIPFIFNRFFRVDQSRTSGAKGFGLGLAIVHRIANLHQAEIKVDSQFGRGTRICVIFPLHNKNAANQDQ